VEVPRQLKKKERQNADKEGVLISRISQSASQFVSTSCISFIAVLLFLFFFVSLGLVLLSITGPNTCIGYFCALLLCSSILVCGYGRPCCAVCHDARHSWCSGSRYCGCCGGEFLDRGYSGVDMKKGVGYVVTSDFEANFDGSEADCV
jgi:hypothetical protein